MKILALLPILLCMFFRPTESAAAGADSLAAMVLDPPASPLRPLQEQVVYFSVASNVKEGRKGLGRIQLAYPQLDPVEFRIRSLPNGVIEAPAKVEFPSGVTERYFEFKVKDDELVNPSRTTYLSLWVGEIQITRVPVMIQDDEEPPTLAIRIPKRLAEGEAKSTGKVTLDRPAAVNIAVSLKQSRRNLLSIPKQIVIRAGKTENDFKIGATENLEITGDINVTVTAEARDITTATAQTMAMDNESSELRLKLPAQVVEGSPATGSVEIPGTVGHVVRVTLRNGASSRLSLPATVKIPAGKTKATFTLTAMDSTDKESSTKVSIRASASGFSSDEASTEVREITGLPHTQAIQLATNDLIWDPQRERIYASVPSSGGSTYGNHVVAIDPVTRQITGSLAVYQEPGQLALTSGGEFLYVVRNGNGTISKIALANFTESQVFAVGTDPFYGTLFAEDICTVAGQPDLLIVSQYRKGVSPRHNGVAVYENGVARGVKTQDHTGSNAIEPSADPTIFFGYNQESTEYGFRRIKLDASGLTQIDVNTSFISGFGVDIRSDGDMVISTSGDEVDGAQMKRAGTYPIETHPCLVCPDHVSNRVYIMEPDYDYWDHYSKIVAYDPYSRTPIRTMKLLNTAESPGSLIRWGDSGIAYRTPGEVVLITNETLVPGEPPADLAVTVQASPNPAKVGQPLTYTIQVTNHGPNAARSVVVNATLSSRQTVSGASSPHGSPIISGSKISLPFAEIASGATETLTVATTPLSAGSLSCTAGAVSNAIDPENANNTGFSLVSVGFESAIDKVNTLYLTANNLVYDSTRQVLWASIPDSVEAPLGKSVVSIDPLTGLLSEPLPLNANPYAGSMALSANGRYLYVGLTDAPEVHRIDLDSEDKTALRISLPLSQWRDANHAQDIEVLDGDGTSFIYAGTDDHAAAVMDGTVMRATRTSFYSVDRLARSGTPGVFIGYNSETSGFDLSRLSVTSTGVEGILKYSNVISGYSVEIAGDGDFVLSSTGRLVDSRTLTLIANLSTNGAPCVDAANQRAYMVSGNNLLAYDTTNGNAAGSFTLRTSGSTRVPERCIRWGTNGFAVIFSDGIILIARLSLAEPAVPAPALAASEATRTDVGIDTDGDGLSDQIESFFGTPTTSVTANPLRVSVVAAGDETILHLAFPRRAGLAMPTYGYQISSDLLEWNTPRNVTETVVSVSTTDGVEIENIDAAIRVPKAKACFVRLVWPQ